MDVISKNEIELINEIRPLKILKLLAFVDFLRQERIPNGKIQYSGCAICGRRSRLNIHHLSYKDKTTMLLCRNCHLRVHFGKGLEHLNPVGKKNWVRRKKRIETLYMMKLPEKVERVERKPEINGYIKLLEAIFCRERRRECKMNRTFEIINY